MATEQPTGQQPVSESTDWLSPLHDLERGMGVVVASVRALLQPATLADPQQRLRAQLRVARALKDMGATRRSDTLQLLSVGTPEEQGLGVLLGRIWSAERDTNFAIPTLPPVSGASATQSANTVEPSPNAATSTSLANVSVETELLELDTRAMLTPAQPAAPRDPVSPKLLDLLGALRSLACDHLTEAMALNLAQSSVGRNRLSAVHRIAQRQADTPLTPGPPIVAATIALEQCRLRPEQGGRLLALINTAPTSERNTEIAAILTTIVRMAAEAIGPRSITHVSDFLHALGCAVDRFGTALGLVADSPEHVQLSCALTEALVRSLAPLFDRAQFTNLLGLLQAQPQHPMVQWNSIECDIPLNKDRCLRGRRNVHYAAHEYISKEEIRNRGVRALAVRHLTLGEASNGVIQLAISSPTLRNTHRLDNERTAGPIILAITAALEQWRAHDEQRQHLVDIAIARPTEFPERVQRSSDIAETLRTIVVDVCAVVGDREIPEPGLFVSALAAAVDRFVEDIGIGPDNKNHAWVTRDLLSALIRDIAGYERRQQFMQPLARTQAPKPENRNWESFVSTTLTLDEITQRCTRAEKALERATFDFARNEIDGFARVAAELDTTEPSGRPLSRTSWNQRLGQQQIVPMMYMHQRPSGKHVSLHVESFGRTIVGFPEAIDPRNLPAYSGQFSHEQTIAIQHDGRILDTGFSMELPETQHPIGQQHIQHLRNGILREKDLAVETVDIVLPHMREHPDVIKRVVFVDRGTELHMIVTGDDQEAAPVLTYLQSSVASDRYQENTQNVTLALAGSCGVGYPPHKLRSFRLATVEELEDRHLRFQEDHEELGVQGTGPAPSRGERAAEPSAEDESGNAAALEESSFLKVTRKVLLQELAPEEIAHYAYGSNVREQTLDADGKARTDYTRAGNDYVVITLPARNRQLVIRHNPSLAFILPGIRPREEFRSRTNQRRLKQWGRELHWVDARKFAIQIGKALRTNDLRNEHFDSLNEYVREQRDVIHDRLMGIMDDYHARNEREEIQQRLAHPSQLTIGRVRGILQEDGEGLECGATKIARLMRGAGIAGKYDYAAMSAFLPRLLQAMYPEHFEEETPTAPPEEPTQE